MAKKVGSWDLLCGSTFFHIKYVDSGRPRKTPHRDTLVTIYIPLQALPGTVEWLTTFSLLIFALHEQVEVQSNLGSGYEFADF